MSGPLALVSLFAGLTASSLAAGTTAGPATDAGRASPTTVELQPYAGRLLTVEARLGREDVRLLVDTGGGQTLVTPKLAARLGCVPSGRGVALRMTGERVELAYCDSGPLRIGGAATGPSELAVWDLMAILPKELPPLDGVLALDSFVDQPFTLELAARRLTLETSSSLRRRTATMQRVYARVATGLAGRDRNVLLRGSVGREGWFLMDTGNLDLVQIPPHMLAADRPGSPEFEVPLALAGLPPASAKARLREIIYDAVLSESVLSRYVWTFRLSTSEVWASPVR